MECSHEAFGKLDIISEDEYGELANFGEKLGDKESELDPMVVYMRQLGVFTSFPIG